MRVSVTAVALGFVFVGLTPGKAGGQTGSRTPYSLSSPSNFARGCFGPCACPVLQSKLSGTFDLRSLPPDPMFSNYASFIRAVHVSCETLRPALRVLPRRARASLVGVRCVRDVLA